MNQQTIALLIDEGIKLDQQIKVSKKRLDQIKAGLTNIAYEEMENKSLKYLQIYGTIGRFNTAYKEKFEIDNFGRLCEILGEIATSKITRKEEVKYDVDDRFKSALIALFKGEFSKETTIDEVLQGLGLDAKAIKTAKKKLKGDYIKDKKVLESLGVTGAREEELDAIRLYKNYELVERFFDGLDARQIELIKKAIFVEEQLSVGFDYQDNAFDSEAAG